MSRATYLWVLLALFFIVLASAGPGIWQFNAPAESSGYTLNSWQYLGFRQVCHQQPSRSFHINAQPMAVCQRCFGIYTGAFMGLLIVFFLRNHIRISRNMAVLATLFAFSVIGVDVLLNMLNVYSNTPVSRVSTGVLLGLSIAQLFNNFTNARKS